MWDFTRETAKRTVPDVLLGYMLKTLSPENEEGGGFCMNGHRHRFRFLDDEHDCDLCVVRFMQGKSKPLCDPVPPDCPHIISKENGVEDPVRCRVFREVRNRILQRFSSVVYYPRSEILNIIDELEVAEK